MLIPVLDKGNVRMVDSMGNDLSIVRNARVSHNAAWRAGQDSGSDAKLINYLYTNGHNTPFESVVVTFDVKAPIFVFRQWHRHRTQSYNETSARYTVLSEEYYVPELDQITEQSNTNKQGKTAKQNISSRYIRTIMEVTNSKAFDTYRELLALKCPKELARSVLPVSTYSQMFATANLHNWFNFLRERLHPHAQYEIRVYAQAILSCLEKIAPVATSAFICNLSSASSEE